MKRFLSPLVFITIILHTATSQQLLELTRVQRAATYQSNFVDSRFFKLVNTGDPLPPNAVKPFERPLRYSNTTVNVAVAFWIPEDRLGLWGSAWEENGVLKAAFVKDDIVRTNLDPLLSKGFRILIYPGTPESNNFRFSWVKSSLVDEGTVLYSGLNKHVPSVFVEDDKNEFLGDSDWEKRRMNYVVYGNYIPHTVANYEGHNVYDRGVYVLTKQRCSCEC